ncbi:hypothetical protein [Williamsia sterculiae]|uniref:Uncharacterized protein n=1 Tax=Williamsia sterculiae TaxID=1344003 RepID=A0A1N7HC66_9NOCA|nr:hypothetical protein [Williamsia sterculiae]SIS22467.1 hypothetical protein SAMN05445060_3956 [Williamsia sterculiae]
MTSERQGADQVAADDIPGEDWIREASRELRPSARDADRVSDRVIAAARRLSQSRRLLITDRPGVEVSSVVLNQLLFAATRAHTDRELDDVQIGVGPRGVEWIRLGVIGRYSDDLQALADQIRAQVVSVVEAALGPDTARGLADAVDVDWTDLQT